MKTGLVVIDMLNDFVEGGIIGNPASSGIIEPIKSLIEAARKSDEWVVIYSNDAHMPGDFEFKVFGEHALAGSKGAAVIDIIEPKDGDEVVNKRYYSTFTQTDMDSVCKVNNIDRLVIVGQHTDCCVRHTSYDAYVRGIEIAIPSDATAVFAPPSDPGYQEKQLVALDYLANIYGASITTTEGLLSEIN